MMAYFGKRIRQFGQSENFLADCHFLMGEDMAEIKFTYGNVYLYDIMEIKKETSRLFQSGDLTQ